MRVVVVLLVLTVAACASGSPRLANVSPSPTSAGSPSSSGAPTPSASPAPEALNLSCRLPVTWAVQNGQLTNKAGFVTFPAQTLTEDASAPANSVFYDRAVSKWLPVGRANVSPDGKRYAYTEGSFYLNTPGKVHVVDVATGADKVIYSGSYVYSVVDFAAEGIYLTTAAPEGRPRGLWLQDPAGGAARHISSVAGPAIGGGAAWGVDFNAADPSPGPGGIEGPMNRVLRIDLRSSAASPWFYLPGADVYMLGFDTSGNPLVGAGYAAAPTDTNGQNSYEVWQVTSATAATRLFASSGPGPLPSRLAAVDSHGVWFDAYGTAGPGRVWLYSGGSIRLVATLQLEYFSVAGGCIP